MAATVRRHPPGLRGGVRREPTRRSARRAWWWWRRRAPRTPHERERLDGRGHASASRPPWACLRTWWPSCRRARCPRPRAARSGARATRDLYLAGALGRAARHAARPMRRLGLAARSREAARPPPSPAAGRGLYAAYLAVARRGPSRLLVWLPVALVPSRRAAPRAARARVRARPLCLAGLPARASRAGAPPAGAAALLLASNHASYVDVPALLAAPARATSCSWPRGGAAAGPLVGHLRPAGRPPHRRPLRRRGRAWPTPSSWPGRSSAGESVLLFPEGTFTAAAGPAPVPPGRLQGRGGDRRARRAPGPPRARARRAARRPCVPRPGRDPRSGSATPIAPEGTDWRAVVALRDRVADAIAAHCGEPRLDLVAARTGAAE